MVLGRPFFLIPFGLHFKAFLEGWSPGFFNLCPHDAGLVCRTPSVVSWRVRGCTFCHGVNRATMRRDGDRYSCDNVTCDVINYLFLMASVVVVVVDIPKLM